MNARVVGDAMRAYYDQRASEYDDWWLGSGLFAKRVRPGWPEEVTALIDVLSALTPCRWLDVACGTGFLTQHLQGEVVALDQAPAMIEIVSALLPSARTVCGDAVPLPFETASFDRILTSHFYGHLLAWERDAFLAEARRVAHGLIVIDSALRDDVEPEEWQQRTLNDGSQHQVYKRYFTGPQLAAELDGGTILHDGHWFVAVEA
jgi:demethylmenaquinone methyltransferase/2-methoxy-6-polyprenyl-1,4-benzoquinol methylase